MSASVPTAASAVRRGVATPFVRWLLLVAVVWISATAGETDFTFVAADVPRRVPTVSNPVGSQAGITTSTIAVRGITSEVVNVKVSMWLSHSWPSDLIITLISPQNIRVTLIAERGGNNRGGPTGGGVRPPTGEPVLGTSGIGVGNAAPPFGQVVFDQDATLPIGSPLAVNNVAGIPVDGQAFILSGTYIPEESFDAFSGLVADQVNGNWTLEVDDTFPLDEGSLRAWTLSITESGPHTWTGLANDGLWETPGNWLDDYPPSENERNATITFPDFLPNSTTVPVTRIPGPGGIVRSVDGGLLVRALVIADGYTFSGEPIGIADDGAVTTLRTTSASAGVPIVINNDMPMEGASFFTPITGSSIEFAGTLSDGGTSASITHNGLGTSLLSNANTYTGLTTVGSGILNISNAGALGGNALQGGTVVSSGGTLGVVTNAMTVPGELLTLAGSGTANQGALSASVDLTWTGAVTLSATSTGVGASVAGVDVQLDAFAASSTSHSFNAYGGGTIALNGQLPILTSLTVNGGQITAVVAQPSVTTMTLNGGTILPTAAITAAGTISSAGATASTLGAGTINLTGGRTINVSNTLNVISTFTNGSLAIRGGGTVDWTSTSPTTSVQVNSGRMVGAGQTANLSVSTGVLAFTGGHTTGNLSLGSNSLFIFAGAGSVVAASGSASINGGTLQPLANGTIITTGTGNTGEFRFYPRGGTPVNYAQNGDDIAINIAGGATASFTAPTVYQATEGNGPITLNITSTAPMTAIVTSAGGKLDSGGDFVDLPVTLPGTGTFSFTINDDFVKEGTEVGDLILIPLTGGLADPTDNFATLTIFDNDQDDAKKCGFGTGLTVFLLLGFGLLLTGCLRRH